MNKKWDLRFLKLAILIADWSKDPSTQTGAVIVRPNRSICSVGFNGFAQKMSDNPDLYADREIKYSRVIHSEVNAQLFAREPLEGYTLYTWPFASCDRCCVQMLQAGITKFVFPSPSQDALSRWGGAFEKTKKYIMEASAEFLEIPVEEVTHGRN